MSPQPRRGTPAEPAPAETPAENADPKYEGKVAEENHPEVNNLLTLAQSLQTEHEDVQDRKRANRDLLRNYRKLGLASQEQADSIEAFYPTPKRTAKGE